MNSAEFQKVLRGSADEIRAALMELQRRKDALSGQVTQAKRDLAYTKTPVDLDWLHRTEQATKGASRQMRMLMDRLGELNREQKKRNIAQSLTQTLTFERAFMHKAKEILLGRFMSKFWQKQNMQFQRQKCLKTRHEMFH